MKELNDGGPAFPFAYRDSDNLLLTNDGLTIRDWFAGLALEGRIARGSEYISWADAAEDAYEIADAMLKAREVKP